jgi:hypothetical protein
MRKTTNNEMARKKRTRAAAAAPTAMPVNPIAPATIETRKNTNAHRNIMPPLLDALVFVEFLGVLFEFFIRL